jgi:hypothetical protein
MLRHSECRDVNLAVRWTLMIIRLAKLVVRLPSQLRRVRRVGTAR